MKHLTQTQLVNRISALIKGQLASDCVNALLMNATSIFENCGHNLLKISIAGTMTTLTGRLTQHLVTEKAFSLNAELQQLLEDIVENGPINTVGHPVDSDNLVKAGLLVRIVNQGMPTFIAATPNGLALYLSWYSVSTIEEAKAKKAAPTENPLQPSLVES
jgi:hypothetical protein